MKTETEKFMGINDLTHANMTSWVTRAVKSGVIPPDGEVLTAWLSLSRYNEKEVMAILSNTPAKFEHQPGFAPMDKESEEYKTFDEKKAPDLSNHVAKEMIRIKNQVK